MTKKNIIFLSISLVLIILLGIGVSYSMWNVSVSQNTNNTAYTECFDLSVTNKENNISLENAYPISNDKGKSLTPYTFTITNTCDITTEYSVNLEVLNNSTLTSKFIDVMFEGNINLLSSYDNTDKVNTSSIESRKLTTGILKSKESKDYSLRLWIDYNTTLEDLNNEVKSFKSKIVVVGKPINYTGDTVFNFDYTGGEQTFIAPVSGTYKLETWGAQGGSFNDKFKGGNGGYSAGLLFITKDTKVYINVGQGGNYCKTTDFNNACSVEPSYNGGGSCRTLVGYYNDEIMYRVCGAGGGATHISLNSGLLENLSSNKDKIVLVSGGGGGATIANYRFNCGAGGSSGGDKAMNSTNLCTDNHVGSGATSLSGFAFGLGQSGISGGGGGYYGGNSSVSGSGGGSSYIGNPLLTNKVMYCYNCEESNEESTKTISTTCNEETPTSYCAKKGNGYARITIVSLD